jgi:hypothetical protein
MSLMTDPPPKAEYSGKRPKLVSCPCCGVRLVVRDTVMPRCAYQMRTRDGVPVGGVLEWTCIVCGCDFRD